MIEKLKELIKDIENPLDNPTVNGFGSPEISGLCEKIKNEIRELQLQHYENNEDQTCAQKAKILYALFAGYDQTHPDYILRKVAYKEICDLIDSMPDGDRHSAIAGDLAISTTAKQESVKFDCIIKDTMIVDKLINYFDKRKKDSSGRLITLDPVVLTPAITTQMQKLFRDIKNESELDKFNLTETEDASMAGSTARDITAPDESRQATQRAMVATLGTTTTTPLRDGVKQIQGGHVPPVTLKLPGDL